MQFRKRVWTVIAVVCVGATLCEIPNGRLLWRQALSERDKHTTPDGDKAVPALSEAVRTADPEAAAILEYCLSDPNDEALASMVARYPQNEFFLTQLAERLLEAHYVDRQAALTVADELVALNPENAHYRYLKGWMLLKPPHDAGDEQKALEQFQEGNRRPEFYLPLGRYRERVDRLCDEVNVSLLDKHRVHPSQTNMYLDLGSFLSRSQALHATLGPEAFDKLSAAIPTAAEKLIANGRTFGQLEHGMFLLQLTEGTRLRKVSSSPEQAWQSRLHLGQALALSDMLQRWYDELFAGGLAIGKAALAGLLPLVMLLPLPLAWLFMVIVNLIRGRTDAPPVRLGAYVLFVLGLTGFFALHVAIALLNDHLPGSYLASIASIAGALALGGLWWLLSPNRTTDPARGGRSVRLVARILRTRLIQTIMLLLTAAGAITLANTLPLVPTVLSLATVVLLAVTQTHVTDRPFIGLDALRRFLSKQGPILATRTQVARMILAILMVCWLGILASAHVSAGKCRRLETLLTDPLALYGPVPQATRETYERRILGSEAKEAHHHPWGQDDVPSSMYLAAPADVQAFLTACQKESKPLDDRSLYYMMVKGGRDIRPVVLNALQDPNDLDVLSARATWGDVQVKEQLVTRFEQEFAELGEPYVQMRQDPNCLQGIILKAGWGDEKAKAELEQRFAGGMNRLMNTSAPREDRDRLRAELKKLLSINEASIRLSEHGYIGRFMRRSHARSELVERLMADADMLDLGPFPEPAIVTADQLESLLDLAGTLAFVSEPQEAQARLQWLMAPLVERRHQERNRLSRSRRRSSLSENASFYRALRGVPQAQASALLRQYLKNMQVSDPFGKQEFLRAFRRTGDRALAEWIVQKVAESPPSEEVPDVPVGRVVNIFEELRTYRKDTAHEYLDAAFVHLNLASAPLLLEHLDSDYSQVQAFVVWRLTSLGYDWSQDQVHPLLADSNWKVRLNALFACEPPALETATNDTNDIVRVIARLLVDAPRNTETSDTRQR